MRFTLPRVAHATLAVATGLLLAGDVLGGQTPITAPNNKYTPAQDVELGRKAAVEVEQQLPMLRDEAVESFVASIGRRLVQALPQEFRHPEFHYSFQVVNVRDINAFALPGGPMYVNRGMIAAADTQGEVASVIAHELSHVALRHGTAQATKATPFEIGTIAGAIVGSMIGGNLGSVVAQGTQFGLGTVFLKFSREFERQADLLGSHIMATAGYDPREMATMFNKIAKEGKSGGPQWLSDHPDPGDRSATITREARLLTVESPIRDTRAFTDAQARLRRMPAAPTTEEATRKVATRGGRRPVEGRPDPTHVAPPSSTYTSYDEGDVFRVSVPANWQELPGNSSVLFAPDGGYGTASDQRVFTHGMEIGVTRNETHDLRTAVDEFVASLAHNNPDLGRPSGYSRTNIGGLQGLRTTLMNRSQATGEDEGLALFAVLLDDRTLFYAIGVAPGDRFSEYESTFRRIVSSITLRR